MALGLVVCSLAKEQDYKRFNALTLDETSVYWGVIDSIRSAPREGGAAVTVVSSAKNPRSFVLDDAIYWTDDGGGVWRAPKRTH